MDPSRQLLKLVDGYQISQALHVAASLGISDLLASGPQGIKELSEQTSTHAPTLRRLMRALESVGVYASDGSGLYSNTELGHQLRSDVPGSLAGWAIYVGRTYYRQAWGQLLDSVRTGHNAFATVHGTSVWQYRKDRPEEQAIFDGAMTAVANVVLEALVTSYDFGRYGTVCDIGGNVGTLLAAILTRHDNVRGMLFDQPDVVADAKPVLAAAGVGSRCELIGGDFFESVPSGADAYILKSIIHDWLDDEAIQILGNCRRAMGDDARLLLVEQILGEGPDPSHTAFSDLNMLVSPGGQERTLEEYGELLAASGFALEGATATGTPVFVIEAVASGH